MANVIEIIFKAVDNVTGSAGKVQKSLGGLTKAIGALGVGFAAGAIAKKFLDETTQAQAAVAQLEATLKSTGGAAGRTSEQLQAQASALQKVTTFGDDAIISMQSVLGTFTQIKGTNFDAATVSILDLATKMGTDLQSAAVQVGKALNDPIRGVTSLSRAGVQFSVEQKDLIKSLVDTGKTAEAQAIILKELEVQFGGSAKAARNTLGGALSALSNAFGDLFELTEQGTSGAVDSINALTETLQDPNTIEAAQALGSAIADALGLAVRVGAGLIGVIQEVGREVARAVGGIAIDDVEKRTKEVEKARKELERFRNNPLFGPTSTRGQEKEYALQLDLIEAEEKRNEAIKARARILGISLSEAAGNEPAKNAEAAAAANEKATSAALLTEEALKKVEEAVKAGTSEYDQQKIALQENIKVLDDYLKQSKGLTDEQLASIGTTRDEYNRVADAVANLRFQLEELDAAQDNANIALRQDAARRSAMVSGGLPTLAEGGGTTLTNIFGEKETLSGKGIAIPITAEIPEIEPPENLDEIMKTIYDSTDAAIEKMTQLGTVGEQLADGLHDAFVEFFMNMDKGFKGILQGFVKLVQRMIAEALAAMAVKALLGAFGFSTAASGGKIFGINKMPAQSRPVPGRASGGMVPVRVGEEGPEMAFLPVGTQIMNARQMAFNATGGGMGGGGFNYQPVYDIRIQSSGDPRDVENRLSMMLERRLAQHTNEIMTKMRNNGFGRLR